jgi:putative transposase
MSEQQACRVMKQLRGTQRYRPTQRCDKDTLTQAIVLVWFYFALDIYERGNT